MPQTDTKIGLLNHVGGGNLGDDATLDAVAGNIKRRWPNAEIVALSMNPDDTERRHGIKSYDVRRNRWAIGYKATGAGAGFKARVKTLARKFRPAIYLLNATSVAIRLLGELSFLVSSRRILKSIDLLIISGGGQLTEKDGPWGFPYTIFKWVVLAKSAGVSCVFLNVGAGPLARPLSKFFARQALRAADYVSLRDDKSRTLVHEIGFTGESRVCPDSAYGIEFVPAKSSAREGSCQSIVGFAPMPYPDPDPTGYSAERNQIVYEDFMGKLASFASWLSRSYALALFGTDIGVDPQAIEDLQRTLLSNHGIPLPLSAVNHSTSVRDLLAAMSGMDYVVTCRFHGVIFAHLLNKPVLAIAHHPKVTKLMADLDLSSYCVDIRDFDAGSLTDRFASMVDNAEEIKFRMATRLARNRQQLRSQFDELFRFHSPSESQPAIHAETDLASKAHLRF
ncbi:MAG TPA: polysaccharide pyruvyl transferase family protein [Edaphobacter sp.]|nr:polysaccharide pyruvyl transferase family protein [Edaphobacter sp.]